MTADTVIYDTAARDRHGHRRRRDQHRPAPAAGRRGPLRPEDGQGRRHGQRGPDRAVAATRCSATRSSSTTTCARASPPASASCSRTICASPPAQGDPPRGQPDRARPRRLLPLPAVRRRQGQRRCGRSRRAGDLGSGRPDGQLPRRAARDVRPADRLHALLPPSGTRGEAPVRLSHADLRQQLRTRPGRVDPLPFRARPELRLHLRADLHAERGHGAGAASTVGAAATATPRSPAAAPTRSFGDNESKDRGKQFRGYIEVATATTVSAITRRPASTSSWPSDNTFLDRYQISDSRRAAQPCLSGGRRAAQFLVAQRLLLPGPAPVRRSGHDPRRPAAGRDPPDQRPVALGLLLHRRQQYPGPDAQPRASTRGGCRTRSAGPCPISARSATSTASTSACAATSTAPKATRRPSAPRAARRSEAACCRASPADWSWPLADATGDLGRTRSSRWSASTWRRPAATPATSRTRTARTSSSTRPTCSSPAAFPASTASRAAPRSPTACASARSGRAPPRSAASSGRATRSPTTSPFPERFRPAATTSPTMSARSTSGPSALLDLSYRFRLGKSDLQFRRSDALAAFGPAFLRFNLGYLNLSKEPEAFDDDGGDMPTRAASIRARRSRSARGCSSPSRSPIGGQTRQDLSANRTVANQLGLIYTHPCLVLAVGFEQRLTPDAELGDETAVAGPGQLQESRRVRDRRRPVRV